LLTCLNRSNVPTIESRYSSDEIEKKKRDFISLLFKPSKGFTEPSLSKNILETAAPLFRHLRLLSDFQEKFFLIEYKSVGHLHLDSAAVRALELFSLVQDDDDEPVRGFGTLYDHVNKCRSDAGRKLLRQWMRRPLSDLRRINERLDAVEALTESHSPRSVLSDSLLRQIPDISAIERKLLQKKANLFDCYRLYRLVGLLSKVGFS
jgi:DNA mismatch repair protein MSH2